VISPQNGHILWGPLSGPGGLTAKSFFQKSPITISSVRIKEGCMVTGTENSSTVPRCHVQARYFCARLLNLRKLIGLFGVF